MCKTLLIPMALMLALGTTAPAQAQAAQTYVSAGATDAGDCPRLAPCGSFAYAYMRTAAGGEITVLSPGGYGAVIIDRAISINNDGVGEASMSVAKGLAGITINAGPDDVVSLRGLTIRGIADGGNGIVFNSGKSLSVENCVIRSLNGSVSTGNGILFRPAAASSLAVSNTIVADNQAYGILVQPTGTGTVTAVFKRVEVRNNGTHGIYVTGVSSIGSVKATVEDSVVAANAGAGIVSAGNGAPTTVTVARSVAASNGIGLAALVSNATLRLGETVVTGNAASWLATGPAVLRSYGDNNIDGNGDGDPAPLFTPKR